MLLVGFNENNLWKLSVQCQFSQSVWLKQCAIGPDNGRSATVWTRKGPVTSCPRLICKNSSCKKKLVLTCSFKEGWTLRKGQCPGPYRVCRGKVVHRLLRHEEDLQLVLTPMLNCKRKGKGWKWTHRPVSGVRMRSLCPWTVSLNSPPEETAFSDFPVGPRPGLPLKSALEAGILWMTVTFEKKHDRRSPSPS